MPRFELDLNPVQHITTDAIGQPGQRVFYIQGWRETDPQPVTIIIEKVQLQSLVAGLDNLFEEITRQFPALTVPAASYDEQKMHILPPVDPLYRAGEMGLGYDADRDLVVILAREIVMEGDDPEEAAVTRYWATRLQCQRLKAWALEVLKRGRPICVQCGQPMEPEGHFCPKKNGHKH